MRNWFTFGGDSSKDYGVYISGDATYNGAERDYESVSIPGRNGDLTIDNGRYNNIELTYGAFIVRDFDRNITRLRNYILGQRGYKRLEDTYHPNEFRMARFKGGFEVEPQSTLKEGQFTLTFDCMPQRFLKSGEQKVTLTASGVLVNSHLTETRPLVRVYGTGTVTIGGIPITVKSASGYTDIDCETESAYRGSVNCNSNIVLTDGKFWKLQSGRNTVELDSGISRVEIQPRWWTL